jgi:hypothetical protein
MRLARVALADHSEQTAVARMDSANFKLARSRVPQAIHRPMKNLQENSATLPNAQMPTTCIVCQKPIVDGQWFCRLPQNNNRTANSQEAKISLCSPGCACRYFAFSEIGVSQI